MFLAIQKRINYILIILFLLTALLLYGMYNIIILYTNWGFIGILICFILTVTIVYLLLSFIKNNIETIIIYRMLSKKQIALAKIKKATFYKASRDLYFSNHNIYKFDIEIYTQNHEKLSMTIYEDVEDTNFSSLPGYAYVTYDSNSEKVSLVPTFLLFMSPSLKDIVKDFEETYKPKYLEIVKKHGLTIKKFSNK
ncbi:hypothetical protein [Clostridium sp. HCS.1]|uniref:hypothetical protein n=1 Tax=Clostridium sp. HCS.1 TaxID=3238594 RepID=UPI003A101BD6